MRIYSHGLGRWWALQTVPHGGVCAEIGVLAGDFSERILAKRPRQLHLIDPWEYRPGPEYIGWHGPYMNQDTMDAIYGGVCKRLGGKSNVMIHRVSSELACAHVPEDGLDWIYIDGDHHYDAVSNDIRWWWSKLKPGGLMVFDDLIHPDVRGAIMVWQRYNEGRYKGYEFMGQYFLRKQSRWSIKRPSFTQ